MTDPLQSYDVELLKQYDAELQELESLPICDKLRKSANCQGGRPKKVKQDEAFTGQAVET